MDRQGLLSAESTISTKELEKY